MRPKVEQARPFWNPSAPLMNELGSRIKQSLAKARLCRHQGGFAITRHGGQPKLDLIAGATGDKTNMSIQ